MMGPWPPLIQKPRIEYLEKKQLDNYTLDTVKVELAPGWEPWKCYLVVPEGRGPFPAVVSVYYNPEIAVGLEAPFGGTRTCDYARQLGRRGFVVLSVGRLYDHAHASGKGKVAEEPYQPGADCYYPNREETQLQPSSFQAYVAANAYNALATLEAVDPARVGIVGHSYGGKWALFGACLYDEFACGVWSDPGITIFNPRDGGANYDARWYLNYRSEEERQAGRPSAII